MPIPHYVRVIGKYDLDPTCGPRPAISVLYLKLDMVCSRIGLETNWRRGLSTRWLGNESGCERVRGTEEDLSGVRDGSEQSDRLAPIVGDGDGSLLEGTRAGGTYGGRSGSGVGSTEGPVRSALSAWR